MKHPRDISIADYSYDLPDDRIARFPATGRDESKLLIYKSGRISESRYRHLRDHLPPAPLLVFNNTRVFPARILFKKTTGAVIEVFLLEPFGGTRPMQEAMEQTGQATWLCLIGGASKWKHGLILAKELPGYAHEANLTAGITHRLPDAFAITFTWQPASLTFSQVLQACGDMPIPPYLKREAIPLDKARYQTVYARQEGSVAAPTAGLHFTESLLGDLKSHAADLEYVTLHVGAGTFLPVKAATMEGHPMHAEFLEVDLAFLEKLSVNTKPVFAVGTTALRTLESLYWMGVKCSLRPDIEEDALAMGQWEVYDDLHHATLSLRESLPFLVGWLKRRHLTRLVIQTRLLIAPGYVFRTISGLITNFHQPQSTLLLLVAALAGDHWRRMYDYALANDFRFLSYGDGCLIFAENSGF